MEVVFSVVQSQFFLVLRHRIERKLTTERVGDQHLGFFNLNGF